MTNKPPQSNAEYSTQSKKLTVLDYYLCMTVLLSLKTTNGVIKIVIAIRCCDNGCFDNDFVLPSTSTGHSSVMINSVSKNKNPMR